MRRRRAALLAGVVVLLLGAVAVTLVRLREQISSDSAAVASPVASSALDLGRTPPNRIIASAGPVELNLPVDRTFAQFTLFRPIDDLSGVGMKPDDSWKHTVWPDDGLGPRTAGMDIAAPPDTIVFSPVSGTITGVSDYVVAGKVAGFQVDISPKEASDIVVRVRHITEVPIHREASPVCKSEGVERPRVGEVVTAGVTCLGQVLDVVEAELLDSARPLVAKYTSDGGNHVHVEVVRVPS